MMKKISALIIILLFIVTLAAPAFCADNAATKLGRGFANMLTFPLEIPEQISRTNNSDGPFAGWTVGVVKGLGAAVVRACVGVYETATFLVPAPDNYKPILKDPEYFLETSNF
jgi:putative exosortase-associated protein (TIGR04073 family)